MKDVIIIGGGVIGAFVARNLSRYKVDALVIEKKDSPYVNLLIANKESAQNEDLKKVINELTSADVKKFIEKQYDGAVVPAF